MANSLATKKTLSTTSKAMASSCRRITPDPAQRVAAPAASGEALTASAEAKFGFHKKQRTQKRAG